MKKEELTKITDYLLLYSPRISDIGLFHGKMGIATALYMHSAQFGDKTTGEFAWELFQQVYDGVNCDMPVGLENGLAGIGYGTTLLTGLGLLDGDLDDVLMEIDVKIMERDPRRMTDFSMRNGAGGILLYINLRRSLGCSLRSFDNGYLLELQQTGVRRPKEPPSDILRMLHEPTFGPDEYIDRPLGIDGGISYHLVKSYLS